MIIGLEENWQFLLLWRLRPKILGRFQIKCLWSKPHSISDNFCYSNLLGRNGGGGLLLLKSPIPIPKKRSNLWLIVALWHEGLIDAGGRGAGFVDLLRAAGQQVCQVQQLGEGCEVEKGQDFISFFCKCFLFWAWKSQKRVKSTPTIPKFVVRLCSFYEHKLTLSIKGPFRGILLSEHTKWQ